MGSLLEEMHKMRLKEKIEELLKNMKYGNITIIYNTFSLSNLSCRTAAV